MIKGVKRNSMQKRWKQVISITLIIVLLVGMIPQDAFAKQVSKNGSEITYTSGTCEVLYKETSSWGNYAKIEVKITNKGDIAVEEWQLAFDFKAEITNIWNADISSCDNGAYNLAAKSYNSIIDKNGTVSFGFIACGDTTQPVAPKDISVTGATDRAKLEQNQEETEIDNTKEVEEGIIGNYSIPEQWKGLEYALFTSGEQNTSIHTSQTYIHGDVHSNQGFCYRGSILEIEGTLEAVDEIDVKTSNKAGALEITNQNEDALNIEMPDITKEVYAYAKENGTVYDEDKKFEDKSIVVEKPLCIEGAVSFNHSSFLGKGIIYAKDSISYNVAKLATPDDSRLFLCSENGDITLNGSNIDLNAVLYAPNGRVNINASQFHLNGRIIAKEICINGSDIQINAGSGDFDMLEFLFKPEIDITIDGKLKENRKVTLKLKEIRNTDELIKDSTKWKILLNGESAEGLYAIQEENSDSYKKELLFKEGGEYTVQVTVTDGKKVYTVEKTVIVENDLEPIANCSIGSTYVLRDANKNAKVNIADLSYSPDNDTIGQRIWTVYYDQNNDGSYKEEEAQIISSENEQSVEYTTSKVGKYKVELAITESFEDTIPSFLEKEDYLSDSTADKDELEKIFEVGNEAPEAKVDIAKSKSTDIILTVGSADVNTINAYNQKAEEISNALEDKGIDANISTVSTSVLTAQDTFAWKEYEHYNYNAFNLPLNKHIQYDGNDIKMVGYFSKAMKDFLYVADNDSGQKIFDFDLERDKTDWHSMEGGGFLFNTTISDEKNTIQGFCILVTRNGLQLAQIDCKNLQGFRDGYYNWVQHAGKLLRTYPLSNLYDNHHFKIVVNAKTISVWDGDKVIIDNFVLPENNYGDGYGPIISHSGHSCGQQSYFTFRNITMQTIKGTTLADVVSSQEWRPGASHYVVHLSDASVPELDSTEETAALAAALVENEVPFIGIGDSDNENQYKALLNSAQTGGDYLSNENISSAMDRVKTYLTDSILAKDYSVGDYITTDDIITYNSYYSDAENDEIYDEKWEYEYDPTVFGESDDEVEHIIRDVNKPITVFENTGAYTIKLNVKDNPVGDNEALEGYRKWSDEELYEKLLLVQSRPVASIETSVIEDSTDSSSCIAKATFQGADPDHPSDSTKGIRKEWFYYKNAKDTEWTEGKLPNKLTVGETYLVMYLVKDIEGTISKPAVEVIETKDLLQYEEIRDTTAPVAYIDVAKTDIELGEIIDINGYATDDYGVESYQLYIDNEKALDSFGRVQYTAAKEGVITVKAVATDIGGNTSEETLQITVHDNSDKMAPTAEITSPVTGADVGFDIQIVGTAKDDTKFKNYTLSYRPEGGEYQVFAQGTEEVRNGVLGNLNVESFTEGIYDILLTVEDEAGNKNCFGIQLSIQQTTTPGGDSGEDTYLTSQLTDIKLSENKENVEFYGTIKTNATLKEYRLTYQLEGKEEVLLTSGTEVKEAELLGTLSTSVLASGNYFVYLTAEDTNGNLVNAKGSFVYEKASSGEGGADSLLADVTPPTADISKVQLSGDASSIELYGTVKDDNALKSYALSYAPDGTEIYTQIASGTETIENTLLGAIPTEGLTDGNYKVQLKAEDSYGNTRNASWVLTYRKGTQEVTYTDTTGTPEGDGGETDIQQEFALVLSHSIIGVGEEVKVQVTLPDTYQQDTLKIAIGDEILATGSKTSSFTRDTAQTVTVTATTVNQAGETVQKESNCIFFDASDTTVPTAEFLLPEADTVLKKPTDITGSAYDEKEMEYYTLEYRLSGEEEYQMITRSTEPKKGEVLGQLDTTKLFNGKYEVRLSVADKGGHIERVTRTYFVEGNLKVGNMHIGFTDITASMAGSTVNVNRNYDSRDKSQGDFGIGWTLGMQGMSLTESAALYDGYSLKQSGSLFSTCYYFDETKCHNIVVNYGDGTSDRFETTFTPQRSMLIPIREVKVGYTCVTNPKVKLDVVGDTTALINGSELVFYDEALYSNLKYKMTTEDRTEIYLDAKKGVSKITSTNGNVITVSEAGYKSEDGKSISFTRDGQGRIIKAEDPIGNATLYEYNDLGDLISVTDAAGRKVSYEYDGDHNLASIIDPNGVAISRNEYDEDGKLIATIDADGNTIEYSYDVEGRTQSIKDRRGNTTVYTYDDNGNILQTIDALGNKTAKTYDENNNLLTTTDANGNVTSYSYDASGSVTEVEAADGTKVKSTYMQDNYVSSISMMDKTVIAMDYDNSGRISGLTDANGNTTEYSYTSDGKLSSITDKIGEYQKVTYDEEGNVLSTTNGAGESASYTYDDDGNCKSVTISCEVNGEKKEFTSYYVFNKSGAITQSTDNAGNVTTYEHDANGNQTASCDAKGRRITYDYDDLGNMVKTTYPDGTTESFTYDANGNNISAKGRNGLSVKMTYDKLDRLKAKTYADGRIESYSYDAAGNMTSQVSTSEAKTVYAYNNRNLNTSITDTYGAVTTFEYDDAARLVKTTDNDGNEISYKYDDNGNIINTTYADGNYITSTYDARNRVIKQEDQNGNERSYEYDGADRLTKVTDAYDSSYSYGYDGNGNLVTVTDASDNVTKYTYDAVGHMESVTNALGKMMNYTYDAIGNLTKFKDYAGNVTEYTYDNIDRVTSKKVGDETNTYTYGERDLLTKVTDNSGTVTYEYDNYDRLIKKVDANENVIAYNYDLKGRISTLEASGKKTAYEYDLLDRITRVIDHNGSATVYEYDSLGNKSVIRYPNGNVMTYTYDACQRLKEECITDASGNALAKYTYGLGKTGERTSVTEVSSDGTVTEISYMYDKLYRLVKESIECDGNKLTNEYEYDELSNRKSKDTIVEGDITRLADVSEKLSGDNDSSSTNVNSSFADNYEIKITEGKTTYAYNDLNQLISETSEEGSISYTYDANGNLVKQSGDKNVTYGYDEENHLLKATVQKGNAVTIESYTYDYAGNRTSREVNENGKIYYVIDESSGLSQVVAETDEKGNVTCIYTIGDERISMERDGNTWYYLYDGHGSVRGLLDKDGKLTDSYSYDAYGNLLKADGSTENDFLYTGEQYNANTGLYYLRARYMNPSTGTFISMDSYQGNTYDPVSLHKYLYANANPVMNTDPTGYFTLAGTIATFGANTSISEVEARYNAMVISIGMSLMLTLKLVTAVENATTRYNEAIGSIIMDEGLFENIDEIVAYVNEQVKEANKDNSGKRYVVYTLVDSDGMVRYVGRTNDYERRMNEHERPGGKIEKYKLYRGIVVLRNLTKEQARGLEQSLLVFYHTQNFLKDPYVKFYNFVNGVGINNSNKEIYYDTAKEYMTKYPTLFENILEEEVNAIKEDMGAWW